MGEVLQAWVLGAAFGCAGGALLAYIVRRARATTATATKAQGG